MPLYHVHVAKGRQTVDPRVVELPDAESAKRYAERLADSLTALSSGFGVADLSGWNVQATDEKGSTLARCGVSEKANAGGSRDTRKYIRR
jgi:hypothetical protein